jgi:hypothetical protein
MLQRTSDFILQLAEHLSAFQEVLCSLELVSYSQFYLYFIDLKYNKLSYFKLYMMVDLVS